MIQRLLTQKKIVEIAITSENNSYVAITKDGETRTTFTFKSESETVESKENIKLQYSTVSDKESFVDLSTAALQNNGFSIPLVPAGLKGTVTTNKATYNFDLSF